MAKGLFEIDPWLKETHLQSCEIALSCQFGLRDYYDCSLKKIIIGKNGKCLYFKKKRNKKGI